MARLKSCPLEARVSPRAVSAAGVLRWFVRNAFLIVVLVFVIAFAGGGIVLFFVVGEAPPGAFVHIGAIVALVFIATDEYVGGEFLAFGGSGQRFHLLIEL